MSDPNSHPSASMVKTLGVINIVLASLGLTIGMCCIDATGLFASSFSRMAVQSSTSIVKKSSQGFERKLESLKEQESEATTEQEKTALRRQRLRLESQMKGMNANVQAGAMDIRLDSPFYIGHYVVQLLSGVTLNILLLIAGTGLLRYADWARKLSIGTAIARIAQLIATTSFQIGFILPYVARQTVAAAANSKSPAAAALAEFGKQNRVIHTISALIFMGLSMIYPIVSIVLLNLRGTKQLCRATKPTKERIHPNREFE